MKVYPGDSRYYATPKGFYLIEPALTNPNDVTWTIHFFRWFFRVTNARMGYFSLVSSLEMASMSWYHKHVFFVWNCMYVYIYMYVFIETKYIFIQKDWMIFFPVVYTAVYSLRFFIRQQLCWWLLFRDHSWEEFVMWFVQLDFVLEVEVVSGDEKRFFPTL